MMTCMSIAVVLSAILLVAVCAVAFREAQRDVRDVFCFLVMLAVSVAVVLVSIVKGF